MQPTPDPARTVGCACCPSSVRDTSSPDRRPRDALLAVSPSPITLAPYPVEQACDCCA